MSQLLSRAGILAILAALVSCSVIVLPNYVESMRLAHDYENNGDLPQAEKYHRLALSQMEDAGEDVPDELRAMQMSDLATSLDLETRATEAIAYIESALTILVNQPEQNPEMLITVLFNYSAALSAAGRPNDAELACRKSQELVGVNQIKSRRFVAAGYACMSMVALLQGDIEAADENFYKAREYLGGIREHRVSIWHRLHSSYFDARAEVIKKKQSE